MPVVGSPPKLHTICAHLSLAFMYYAYISIMKLEDTILYVNQIALV